MFKTFAIDEDEYNFNKNIICIDLSDKISGVLFTVFTAMRKSLIVDVTKRGKAHTDDNISINGKNHEVHIIVTAVNERLRNNKIDFTVATPLMNLMTSFMTLSLSWNEIRTSCSKFQVRGRPAGKGLTDISPVQLSKIHVPFLRGVTYKPERRSGMIKNMGSLALGVNLVYEKKMTNKLEAAFNNSISHIDGQEIICKLMKDAKGPDDIGQLLKLLGDYLLVAGDRSPGRVHFPLLFLYRVRKTEGIWDDFNFSRRVAMRFYMRHAEFNMRFQKRSNGPVNHVAQMIFHAMFETVTEDLGVLGQITNQADWIKRSQADQVFRKSSTALVKTSHFVAMKFFSKLAAANMSKVAGTSNPMVINRIVFAGQAT